MPGIIDEIMGALKAQEGKHYRLSRAEPRIITVRKARGYENVRAEDPAVKGTILADLARPDGTIRVGELILQQTSQENHDRLRAKVQEKNDARVRSIKRKFLEGEEQLKRDLGPNHRLIKFIHKEES